MGEKPPSTNVYVSLTWEEMLEFDAIRKRLGLSRYALAQRYLREGIAGDRAKLEAEKVVTEHRRKRGREAEAQ